MAIDSYTSNQWYNLPTGVTGPGTHKSLVRTDKDNPEFMFPGKVRQNLGIGPSTTISRGFMRCLLTEVDGAPKDLPNRRFFFQFNPERIMRSVSLSSGMTNVLFQDPGQFSVATPGNATFSFDIMLNREMEVNNHTNFLNKKANTTKTNSPISKSTDVGGFAYSTGTTGTTSSTSTVNSGMPTGQDVGQIGVLADLMIMDSIIGQGISDDIISALSKLSSRSSTWDSSDSSSGASAGADPNFISETDASNAFKAIRGNSAFLVSTPVRIVFSSMFMVDGFIQASSVNFTKFNTKMVPTMCVINVQVEAKYIGFAKKDTYLTKSLNELKPAPTSADAGGTTALPEIKKGADYDVLIAALKDSGKYQIAVGGTSDNDHPPFNNPLDNAYFYDDSERNYGFFNPLDGVLGNRGYEQIHKILDYETFLLVAGFVNFELFQGQPSDYRGLNKLFYESNYELTIEHQPIIKLWRSFVGPEKDQEKQYGVTSSGAKKGPGTKYGSAMSRDVLLLDITGQKAVANDFDSWKKWCSYGSEDRTRDKTYDNITNNIFKESGASKDKAEDLYLSGAFSANKLETPLILDIEIQFTARISKANSSNESVYSTTIKDTSALYAKNILFKHTNFGNGIK